MRTRRFKKIAVFFLFLIIGIGFLIVYNKYNTVRSQTETKSTESGAENEPFAGSNVKIKNTVIAVELATNNTAIQKGLSGRESLDANKGMLFVFSKPDIYRFWMPNMYFPIDIVWINNNKIVDISENVSNEFDPTNPVFFTPNSPAQYVLEVNAGFAKSHSIAIGDTVIFNHIR